MIQKKIVLLGMFGVGKTSLIRRFIYDKFEDTYLSTIGVKVSEKTCPPVMDNKGRAHQFQFILWDIEGQIEEGTIPKNYLLGAAGAILVADLTRLESFRILKKLKEDVLSASPEAKFIIIANKSDLMSELTNLEDRVQSQLDPEQTYFISSAKTGENVESSFLELAKLFAGS